MGFWDFLKSANPVSQGADIMKWVIGSSIVVFIIIVILISRSGSKEGVAQRRNPFFGTQQQPVFDTMNWKRKWSAGFTSAE